MLDHTQIEGAVQRFDDFTVANLFVAGETHINIQAHGLANDGRDCACVEAAILLLGFLLRGRQRIFGEVFDLAPLDLVILLELVGDFGHDHRADIVAMKFHRPARRVKNLARNRAGVLHMIGDIALGEGKRKGRPDFIFAEEKAREQSIEVE